MRFTTQDLLSNTLHLHMAHLQSKLLTSVTKYYLVNSQLSLAISHHFQKKSREATGMYMFDDHFTITRNDNADINILLEFRKVLRQSWTIKKLVFWFMFIYSEKATKFCKIFNIDLTVTTQDKYKVEILQKFVAFSEYMNFT